MGKVISDFTNGWAGAISRAVDDIVEAHANVSETAIPFGSPVFRDTDAIGVTGIRSGAGAESFIGFAVRSPAKTPDVYSTEGLNSCGAYAPGEMVDVLTRGSIVLPASGSGISPGKQVYINTETGRAVSAASAGTLKIPNCCFRSRRDPNGLAEVLLTTRHYSSVTVQ